MKPTLNEVLATHILLRRILEDVFLISRIFRKVGEPGVKTRVPLQARTHEVLEPKICVQGDN